MPSHPPASNPSPNHPSLQSSTPITPVAPINPPSPSPTRESPRNLIGQPQANLSPPADESCHLIQPCEVTSDEASPSPTSIISPPSSIAIIPIPSIKLLKILPLPASIKIPPPIKSLQILSTPPPCITHISSDDPYASIFYSPISTTESPISPSAAFEESIPSPPIAPSTPIQSYQDLVQKHVDIPQSTNEGTIMSCLPSIVQSSSPPSPKPQAISPPLQDISSSPQLNQDPILPSPSLHASILSPIQAIPTSAIYPLGSPTFIHGGLLSAEELTFASPICSKPNEALPPFFVSNKYPQLAQMLKRWNYQGHGLGPQEQGIMKPIIAQKHPRFHGLGYVSEGSSSKGVGTPHPQSKHISKPAIPSSHHSFKKYYAIPPPPSLQPKTTYHIPPSSSKSILGPYVPKSTILHPPISHHKNPIPSIPTQDQQRHISGHIIHHHPPTRSSISSPSHKASHNHLPKAYHSNVNANFKMHKAKNPHPRQSYVYSKRHTPKRQNPIKECKTMQKPMKRKSKTMWIPKKKVETQCIMASTIANPPSSDSCPPSPNSILGAYIPKRASANPPSSPHLPSIPHMLFSHPSQHVPMLILQASPSHAPFQPFHPSISYHQSHLIQSIA